MCADVLHHLNGAFGVAGEDHRSLAHHRALEVTRFGHFGFQAHVAPVALVEEAFEFAFVDVLVRVGEEGNAVRTVSLPGHFGGEHRGCFVHVCLLRRL
ncbi:hypothetical protein D9M69_730390 [compost metagenome]